MRSAHSSQLPTYVPVSRIAKMFTCGRDGVGRPCKGKKNRGGAMMGNQNARKHPKGGYKCAPPRRGGSHARDASVARLSPSRGSSYLDPTEGFLRGYSDESQPHFLRMIQKVSDEDMSRVVFRWPAHEVVPPLTSVVSNPSSSISMGSVSPNDDFRSASPSFSYAPSNSNFTRNKGEIGRGAKDGRSEGTIIYFKAH